MICVYEDEPLEWLSPLVELRPVFDLRCGRLTLLEKLRRRYPREEFVLWVRDELAELTRELHPGMAVNEPLKGGLVLSARVVLDEPVNVSGPEAVLLAGEKPVGFRLGPRAAVNLESVRGLDAELTEEQVRARVVCYPWDLVEMNASELARELAPYSRAGRGERRARRGQMQGVVVGSRSALRVEFGARVWPGAVISTETGPVFVDQRAAVRPGSLVEGPCYIGPGTVIDGARVRPGCSFGPECRIGGEVEATVFQGYSNKHHEGFVGHSYVGEWVNLGALTTTSDLKNTYESVRVFYQGGVVDTGLSKVGCFFGDHVKTA
ncbi:MAG: putative sugar nucleotidyl transferase, partial [candidate division WOR-3 bacterium]